MPPARRSRTSGGPASKGSQKTLSFNSSKVTKPTTSSAKDNLTTAQPPSKPIFVDHPSPDPAVVAATPPPPGQQEPPTDSAPVPLKTTKPELTPEQAKAEKVTDAQIKRYWRAQESERRAPRVHQEDLGVEEKILRLFDMSSQYGPCIGIARMKRWVRAEKLGLAPPIEVLAVLMREEGRGNAGIERAHVDELLGTKAVLGEA